MNTPKYIDYRRNCLPLDKCLTLRTNHTSKSARDLVRRKQVKVNGAVAKSCKLLVQGASIIQIDDNTLPSRPKMYYYVLYKPRQVLTSRRLNERDSPYLPLITEFFQQVPASNTIKPVGRLDVESEGLIILTNDGSMNRILTSPNFGVRKVYRVLAGRDVVKNKDNRKTSSSSPPPPPSPSSSSSSSPPPPSPPPPPPLSSSSYDREIGKNTATLPSTTASSTTVLQLLSSLVKKEQRNDDYNSKEGLSNSYCVGIELHDQGTYSRVDKRARMDSQLIVIDITMESGKNREVRKLLQSIGFRTFMLCRIHIQGIEVSVDLPTTLTGIVRHVQREAGFQSRRWMSKDQKKESAEKTAVVDTAAVEGEEQPLTSEEVAWIRDQSDRAASGTKQAYDTIRRKSKFVANGHRLQSGEFRALFDSEIDCLFGAYVTKMEERSSFSSNGHTMSFIPIVESTTKKLSV
jgi:16S rRNA U516 pseudouridylate synthase RsuA-like enzyme